MKHLDDERCPIRNLLSPHVIISANLCVILSCRMDYFTSVSSPVTESMIYPCTLMSWGTRG